MSCWPTGAERRPHGAAATRREYSFTTGPAYSVRKMVQRRLIEEIMVRVESAGATKHAADKTCQSGPGIRPCSCQGRPVSWAAATPRMAASPACLHTQNMNNMANSRFVRENYQFTTLHPSSASMSTALRRRLEPKTAGPQNVH